MILQLTATVYIIETRRTLLVWHEKLQKWQPPGGHMEPGELPHLAALREAEEETGLQIDLWDIESGDEPLIIDRPNAKSLPRPYLLMLQNLPPRAHQAAHQHLDFSFIAKPRVASLDLPPNSEGNTTAWFTREQLQALTGDKDIFVDTLQILSSIFNHPKFAASKLGSIH